ncbi:hypothetical protein SAMN05421504_1011370 [Amycolatopsis xylanica]|uniref:Uncharacterized protein n=1 Tax=Amycolatopsis xylanica TaxID=589385 RepID=A0A1H2VYV3_9PSEU|nr:hypothetical protein [Amycolatopsis xylanica]SDW73493.1 hypothetical protein SAMN05421504_1011370 [Amycolatopsis xylanica]
MKKYHGYSRADGGDPVLWKPGVDPDRLRWHAVRWRVLKDSLWPWPASVIGVGTCAIALSESALMTALGIALLVTSACFTWLIFACDKHDLCWKWTADRLMETRRGELFHAASDFNDLPEPISFQVRQIIDYTTKLHGHQGVDWLGACVLEQVHKLAWEIVSCVDRTRELRDWVSAASADDELAEHVRRVEAGLTEIEHGAHRVADCLRQVVELADAWTEKLCLLSERADLLSALDRLELPTITSAVRAMEEIPDSVFAYVTAARDLIGGGPFAWERH